MRPSSSPYFLTHHRATSSVWFILMLLPRFFSSVSGFSKRLCSRSKKNCFPYPGYHSSSVLRLNRFLFDATELDSTTMRGDDGVVSVTIPKDDYRTVHAAKILGLHNGDTVRAGIVLDAREGNRGDPCPQAGLITDTATIQWIPEGKVKKAEPLGNGSPPGALRVILQGLGPAPVMTPRVSLILALPRPLQLNRMLPMICQMGVEHLILTEAEKVPKDYFGSHLFRHPDRIREQCIEGLCQAGDVRLPPITVVRNLRQFLHDDIDRIFPPQTHARILAHPERLQVPTNDGMLVTNRLVANCIDFPCRNQRRIVLAVGPEGGWAEPKELDLLMDKHNFQAVTMGPRVLRSDVAVVALMALAHEACQT